MHRGYSWPGLEKVSQTIYADKEEAKQAEDRKVGDVKVCLLYPYCPITYACYFYFLFVIIHMLMPALG